jgi:hypothetical protein
MIIIDPIKDEENFTYSTVVTYPKTTQISHGVYDSDDSRYDEYDYI